MKILQFLLVITTLFSTFHWAVSFGNGVLEIGGVSLEVWVSKVCNNSVDGKWVIINDHRCYCKKITIGFIITVSKFKLEACEPINNSATTPTTTTIPSTPTISTTPTSTTRPIPNICPSISYDGIPKFSLATNVDFWTTKEDDLPAWSTTDDGLFVKQINNNEPSGFIGPNEFEGVDLKGTFWVANNDDDYIGIIFSYTQNSGFYIFSWKRAPQELIRAGFTLQVIQSFPKNLDELRNVLWTKSNVTGLGLTLFKSDIGWTNGTIYSWLISHRPRIGLIRIKIFGAKYEMLIDSGNIFESRLKGGKFGVYTQAQKAFFDNFLYRCNACVSKLIFDSLTPQQMLQTCLDEDNMNEKEFIRMETDPSRDRDEDGHLNSEDPCPNTKEAIC